MQGGCLRSGEPWERLGEAQEHEKSLNIESIFCEITEQVKNDLKSSGGRPFLLDTDTYGQGRFSVLPLEEFSWGGSAPPDPPSHKFVGCLPAASGAQGP